jgi:hypothetical protein
MAEGRPQQLNLTYVRQCVTSANIKFDNLSFDNLSYVYDASVSPVFHQSCLDENLDWHSHALVET